MDIMLYVYYVFMYYAFIIKFCRCLCLLSLIIYTIMLALTEQTN